MNITTFIILVIIGLLVGIMGGMLGLSGAVLLIPALTIFVGLDQHTATGTSLAFMLPPIGLFAAYNYYNAGYVNVKYAIILAVAFMVGSYFSSKFALDLPKIAVRKIFSIMLIIIAIKMFFTK